MRGLVRTRRFCIIWACTAIAAVSFAEETALDRYVAKPDPTYSWKLARQTPGDDNTQYVIDLTSQTWRTKRTLIAPFGSTPSSSSSRKASLRIRRFCSSSVEATTENFRRPLTPRRSRSPARPAASLLNCAWSQSTPHLPSRPNASQRRRHHRLHLGPIPEDRRRNLARSPPNGQERCPRDGHRAGIPQDAEGGGSISMVSSSRVDRNGVGQLGVPQLLTKESSRRSDRHRRSQRSQVDGPSCRGLWLLRECRRRLHEAQHHAANRSRTASRPLRH